LHSRRRDGHAIVITIVTRMDVDVLLVFVITVKTKTVLEHGRERRERRERR
jgi:hypothetical protein